MISDDLQWNHLVVTKTKKAAERLYFPRWLKRAGRGSNKLVQFYFKNQCWSMDTNPPRSV